MRTVKQEGLFELGRRLETVASVVYGEGARVRIEFPKGTPPRLQIELGQPLHSYTVREAQRIIENPATFQHTDKVTAVANFKHLPIVSAMRQRPVWFNWIDRQDITRKIESAYIFHCDILKASICGDSQHLRESFEKYDPPVHLPHIDIGTPWGHSHGITLFADGFYSVSTAGHGGLLVSAGFAERFLSEACRQYGERYAGFYCYEEDSAWTLPAWELPNYWVALFRHMKEPSPKVYLRETLQLYYPDYPIDSE